MFHGWMFDPEGDQAAADSTRSSTSLGTGSSLKPRTALRLLTASYTSMITSRGPSFFQTHAISVIPKPRYATEGIAGNRHMAHRRERQMCGDQGLAVRRQLPQKIDPHAGRLHGIVFKPVVPVGMFEPNLEHGVASERQPLAARCQSNHTVPGGVAPGALDEYARRRLIFRFERPQITAELVQEPLGCPPKCVRESRRHGDTGKIRRHPELGLGGR